MATQAAPDVTAQAGVEGAFQIVPLKRLVESKSNPRRHFAGLDELTASVKQHGVLTPLLVRPLDLDGNSEGDLELIAGARRYRAAKAAKLESVPVRILDVTEQQALELQVIENLQRVDVHPLDEALGYKSLLESVKTDAETGKPYDVALIAKKINKSERYVYQRMQLATLIPSAQKAFLEEKLSASHAALLCRLQPAEQGKALKVATDGYSVRQLAEHIRDEFHLELKYAPFDVNDAELLPEAGSCAACPKRTGGNPQLFAEVKEKDLCTDPACFREKVAALVGQNERAGLVSISTSYGPDYRGGKKFAVSGAVYADSWTEAAGKACKDTRDAMVVEAGEYDHPKAGARLKVCVKKGDCKVHGYNSGRTSDPAREGRERAANRKQDAIAKARVEAVRQIAAKAKWPLSKEQFAMLLRAWHERLTYDAGKLIAKVLWPQEKGFDNVRSRVRKWIRQTESPAELATVATVLALVPAWGRWNGTYGDSDKEAAQRMLAFGKAAGVDPAKIEKAYLDELSDKRAKKAGAKRAKATAEQKPKAKKGSKRKAAR